MNASACPLCETDGGLLVFRGGPLRVIQASEAGFPAFYRVVWNQHVAEFSDLSPAERGTCMNAVVAVERVLRAELQPTKINLGFDWDSHFPAPVWGGPQRPLDAEKLAQLATRCQDVNRLIADELAR